MSKPRLFRCAGAPGRSERVLAGAGVTALVASAALAGLVPGTGYASSHREAPLIAGDPRADNTDVYAFVSPDKPDTVTLVANWIPFEEPNGGPNFYPFADDARYHIRVDADGDGKPDTTYTWAFTNHIRDDANQFLYNTGVVNKLDDPTLNFFQTYTLTVTNAAGETKTLLKDVPAAPSNVGKASMPNYPSLRKQATIDFPGGGQTYAGQADDPFFADLRVFDLLYGGNLSEVGHDTLAGYNVNTIAIQVPKKDLALKGDPSRNPVIGVWSTTDRKGVQVSSSMGKSAPTGGEPGGGWKQVSRLGNPLVNEVVVPLKFKDAFNALTPDLDHTITPVVDKVTDPIVPKLIEKIYKVPAPATPRTDLVEIFLTGICKDCGPIQADLNSQKLNKDVGKGAFVPSEELRLNMGVAPAANPNRLGVLAGDLAGFPNGRRLADDVLDIDVQALEGAALTGKLVPALATVDSVDTNDVKFTPTFPYVGLPHTAAVNQGGKGDHTGVPDGGIGAGMGGMSNAAKADDTDDAFPWAPASAVTGGALLAAGGFLALRRRRGNA
ncbi:DUF4331 domain-containing protein [Yinghuangia aomiensis]|uniref:DUF4331 domain-containing protein n=1 Tax=Yinghuangia aomiensis TaxID=676205 RepID=A0ABP9I4B0_9ACTN